jgi:fermentation-respiration switch protein FrsA (DUF1100 family)
VYGESLGCAIALELATRHKPRAVILESAFTSTVDMAKRLFPQLPVQMIVKNRYDNLAKIRRLSSPVLFLHSRSDSTVPYAMGETLFKAAPEPKQFVTLRGSHFLGYHESGAAYPEALRKFLVNIRPPASNL